MRWEVIGTSRASKEKKCFTVEAQTKAEAEDSADLLGFDVVALSRSATPALQQQQHHFCVNCGRAVSDTGVLCAACRPTIAPPSPKPTIPGTPRLYQRPSVSKPLSKSQTDSVVAVSGAVIFLMIVVACGMGFKSCKESVESAPAAAAATSLNAAGVVTPVAILITNHDDSAWSGVTVNIQSGGMFNFYKQDVPSIAPGETVTLYLRNFLNDGERFDTSKYVPEVILVDAYLKGSKTSWGGKFNH